MPRRSLPRDEYWLAVFDVHVLREKEHQRRGDRGDVASPTMGAGRYGIICAGSDTQ